MITLMIYILIFLGIVYLLSYFLCRVSKGYLLVRVDKSSLTRRVFILLTNTVKWLMRIRYGILIIFTYILMPLHLLLLISVIIIAQLFQYDFLTSHGLLIPATEVIIEYINPMQGPVAPIPTIPPTPPVAINPMPLNPLPAGPGIAPPPAANPLTNLGIIALPPAWLVSIGAAFDALEPAQALHWGILIGAAIYWFFESPETKPYLNPGEVESFLRKYDGWQNSEAELRYQLSQLFADYNKYFAVIGRSGGTPEDEKKRALYLKAINRLRKEGIRRYGKNIVEFSNVIIVNVILLFMLILELEILTL